MNANEYQKGALRTESRILDLEIKRPDVNYVRRLDSRLLHAIFGLVTEAGELADQLKKHIFYDKPLDKQNIYEEGGDILWYLAILFDSIDKEMGEAMAANLRKLLKRYPDKFDSFLAQHRDVRSELEALEFGDTNEFRG